MGKVPAHPNNRGTHVWTDAQRLTEACEYSVSAIDRRGREGPKHVDTMSR